MKKWLLAALLAVSFTVQANEMAEVCDQLGVFAGEVVEARNQGISQKDALLAVDEAVADLKGEERQTLKDLMAYVVESIYKLDADGLRGRNAAETASIKRVFVQTFQSSCREDAAE